MSAEDALWSCVSCEHLSAYEAQRRGMIAEVVPVLHVDGKPVPNPFVITDTWLGENGQIIHGAWKTGDAKAEAKTLVKSGTIDLSPLDTRIDEIVWIWFNEFPGCLAKAVDGIRQPKRLAWDTRKHADRHWLAANMAQYGEAFLGFHAFSTRDATGADTIDFAAYRKLLAAAHPMDVELADIVLPHPKEQPEG